jgi:hypothetical protein
MKTILDALPIFLEFHAANAYMGMGRACPRKQELSTETVQIAVGAPIVARQMECDHERKC